MTRSLLILTLAALGALGIANAQQACSKGTLNGGYGITLLGSLQPNNAQPVASVGRVTFDGNGNFLIVRTNSVNGVITQGVTSNGTYTINSDCTGTFALTGGLASNYNLVVDTGGAHVRAISLNSGQTTTFDATKQFIGQ
jgi:hypothetical protein